MSFWQKKIQLTGNWKLSKFLYFCLIFPSIVVLYTSLALAKSSKVLSIFEQAFFFSIVALQYSRHHAKLLWYSKWIINSVYINVCRQMKSLCILSRLHCSITVTCWLTVSGSIRTLKPFLYSQFEFPGKINQNNHFEYDQQIIRKSRVYFVFYI